MFKENAYVTNWFTEVTSLKSRTSQSGHYLCSPPFQNSLSKHNPTPVSWAPRPPRDSAPVAIASRSESSVSPSSRFFLSTYGRALGFYLHRKKRKHPETRIPLELRPPSTPKFTETVLIPHFPLPIRPPLGIPVPST